LDITIIILKTSKFN